MSTQRERVLDGLRTSGDGHAVRLNAAEFNAPKQATGLPLSPVRRLPPGEIKTSEKNKAAFDPLSLPEFDRLKADIAERGVLVPLIIRSADDKTLIAGHNRLRAVLALNTEREKVGEPPLTVPVQYVETVLSPAQEKAFVVKDNLLRRQLKPEQQAKMLAELYPDYLDTVSSSDGGSLGGLKKKIEAETGLSGKTLQRHKATHTIAKTVAKSEGKEKPSLDHYRKALKTLNEQRRAKQPTKTPPKATGKPQSSAAGQSRGQGKGDGDAALRAFNSALNDALRKVEMESAAVLKLAVRHAKSWLKDVERKHRAAESVERKR